LTWVWDKTRSINPEEHRRFDSALRELRSLDRTINQDVLRARYQLIDSYMPVLKSYRRIEELEAIIARPLPYLDEQTNRQLTESVNAYRTAVTAKQDRIERFKYRSADLKELLNYLPGAGTGVAQASQDEKNVLLTEKINHVLQLTLLYNLTSDETYSSVIARDLTELSITGDKLEPPSLKRRVRTLITNIRHLLTVKPTVDHLLVEIFDQPVISHEEQVAAIYARGYIHAEHVGQRYRLGLYALSLCLFFMVTYSFYRLRRSASALAAANASLERRVTERTRELATRNQDMRVVLDNVDQALFTVDLFGFVARERSAALDHWFPNASPATLIWDVFRANEKAVEWLRLGWEQLKDDFLPLPAILDQLPPDIECGGRHYQLQYIPIEEDGKLQKLLLVVSDVTERVAQAQKDAEQQELGVIFRHILRDRAGFFEFFNEAQRLVDAALKHTEPGEIMRALHTLKGNTSMFGVVTLTQVTGKLESRVLERHRPLGDDDQDLLHRTWTAFAERVQSLTEVTGPKVELNHTDLESLRTAVAHGATSEQILRFLRDVEREPAERRLTRISEHTKLLARRLGKGDVVVITESNNVRLDADRWAPFWSTFVHMLRNALDHGIESETERLANGKSAHGQIWLSTKQVENNVVIELHDDGRGIDWDAVRSRASVLGLDFSSEDDLAQILFRGGLSTKTEASEFSGRGTGVSASYSVCREMGGTLTLTTTRGKGTTFRFSIPNDEAFST
jgi:HPt (histidine-containing phosphotransfer) domain-containing protein